MSFVVSCHRKQNYFFVKTHIIHALAETSSEAYWPRSLVWKLRELADCTPWPWQDTKLDRQIDQSHRYGRPQVACREPVGSYDKTTRTAICFEHKTQYILIRAPHTRIVVFWHIGIIPPMISQSQISCNTPTFYIAAIFVKYCYTTGSRLL